MNRKEIEIYISRYVEYKKDISNNTAEYYNARQYHENNDVPYDIFNIIELLYDYNNDIDKIIQVLKIYDLFEE